MDFNPETRMIVKLLAGSNLYGTNLDNSDQDIRGIVIAPAKYHLGLERFEHYDDPDEDKVYYDIKKFVKLVAKGNPHVIEWMYAPSYFIKDMYGNWLFRICREHAISQRLIKHHIGMATNHMRRIDEPGRKCGVKGKELIKKFGYNTKDAACIVRVLEQCIEMLTLGKLVMPRPNADILLNIRHGGWSLDHLRSYIDIQLEGIRTIEEKGLSILPKKPRFNKLNEEIVNLVSHFLKARHEI